MMKKIFLFLTALSVLFTVSAQDNTTEFKRHEFDLGIGVWSSNQIIGTLSDIIVMTVPIGLKMEDGKYVGAISAAYRYSFTERFSLGGVFTYDYGTSNAIYNGNKDGKFYNSYYTLAAEVDYKYISHQNFKLYSLVGVGATLYHQTYKEYETGNQQKNDNVFVNFQITPIGVKFGNSFGAFAELGFGYKGILTVGVFTRI